MIYLYDGTLDGLFTLIKKLFQKKDNPSTIKSIYKNYQSNLFEDQFYIETDIKQSDEMIHKIKKHISQMALQNIIYAFLCETEDVEIEIFKYIKSGFHFGPQIDNMINRDEVNRIHKLVTAIMREKQKFLGFVRFKRVEGELYYAQINPQYNLISLIAPFFADRFSDQNFIIHDVNRNNAIIFNREEWIETPIKIEDQPNYSEEEQIFQTWWKSYFNNISIKERKNSKLQQQFIPKRYWNYLTEMNSNL